MRGKTITLLVAFSINLPMLISGVTGSSTCLLILFTFSITVQAVLSFNCTHIFFKQSWSSVMRDGGSPQHIPTILHHRLGVQFNSTLLLSLWGRHHSTGQGLRSTRMSVQTPVARAGCCLCFWLTGYKPETPMTSSSGLIICESSSQNSETFHLQDEPVYYKWT